MMISDSNLQNPVTARPPHRWHRRIGFLLWLLAGGMVLETANTYAGTTALVSVNNAGEEGNAESPYPRALSKNGRFVCFESFATNLVEGDTNGKKDIFIRDQQKKKTTRVSISSTGEQANSLSSYCALSADGRYVAFGSDATNLVPQDTNGQFDVFVHDLKTGETIRVSVDSFGNEGNEDSAVSPLSRNGRFVAFGSEASNLVAGDTNGVADSFIYDRHSRKGAKDDFLANEGQDDDETDEGTDSTGNR